MSATSFNIILGVIAAVASFIFIIDWLFNKKIKKIYRILLVLGSVFSLTFLGIRIKNNIDDKTPEKPTAIIDDTGKSKPPIVLPPETKQDSIETINKNNSNPSAPALADIKQIANPIELFNKSVNADFAVLAVTDGKRDNQLASVFVDWLKKYGRSSSSVLLNSFIELGYFNQIVEGNSSAILNTNVNQVSPYICLVRSTIDYSNSSIEGLKLANATYDIIIIETKSGKIIESEFNHPESSSDITDKKAKQRTEGFLANYLSKRKLSL